MYESDLDLSRVILYYLFEASASFLNFLILLYTNTIELPSHLFLKQQATARSFMIFMCWAEKVPPSRPGWVHQELEKMDLVNLVTACQRLAKLHHGSILAFGKTRSSCGKGTSRKLLLQPFFCWTCCCCYLFFVVVAVVVVLVILLCFIILIIVIVVYCCCWSWFSCLNQCHCSLNTIHVLSMLGTAVYVGFLLFQCVLWIQRLFFQNW